MERGEHVTNPHEHVTNPHEHVANPHEHVANPHEHVANLSECVANMSRAPTIMSGLRLKRYNDHDHRAGTSNLNIEKRDQVRLRVHRFVIPQLALRKSFYKRSPVDPISLVASPDIPYR